MRTNAREAVFKILYSREFNEESSDAFNKSIYKSLNLTEEDIAFAHKLLYSVINNYDMLIAKLGELATSFSTQRIFPVDKSILLMAFAEILFIDDVPDIVSIDEAVSLVKRYSTENSCNFVNGILASFLENKEG